MGRTGKAGTCGSGNVDANVVQQDLVLSLTEMFFFRIPTLSAGQQRLPAGEAALPIQPRQLLIAVEIFKTENEVADLFSSFQLPNVERSPGNPEKCRNAH